MNLDVLVFQQPYVCHESSHESCHESCHESAWLYRPLIDGALLDIASKTVAACSHVSQDTDLYK